VLYGNYKSYGIILTVYKNRGNAELNKALSLKYEKYSEAKTEEKKYQHFIYLAKNENGNNTIRNILKFL